jgi:hypothetical protein
VAKNVKELGNTGSGAAIQQHPAALLASLLVEPWLTGDAAVADTDLVGGF